MTSSPTPHFRRADWPSSGRGVVVTGAASGIGRAIAERFVANGDHVIGIDRVPGNAAEFGLVKMVTAQAADSAAIRDCLMDAGQILGRLHVLVCAAGYATFSTIPDLPEEEWDMLLAANLRGPYLMAKHGIPILRNGGGGLIINIASQLGFVAARGMAAYCSSKGGLVQLTRALALDHAQEGIRVNALCPGPTDTPGIRAAFAAAPDPAEAERALVAQMPIGRLLHPSEIADPALFLASPGASGITGEAMVVDGGYLLT